MLQDYYLNGDTRNLLGTPIIKPEVPIECLMLDITFGLYFQSLIDVTFANLSQSTNPNILNGMRIVPNGFGALTQQAQGQGNPLYQKRFQQAGGIGPHPDGAPVTPATPTSGTAWINDTTLTSASGNSSFANPIAAARQSGLAATGAGTDITVIPIVVDAEFPGNAPGGGGDPEQDITHRVSWYDLGPQGKQFQIQMESYKNWVIGELPDTNLVVHIFQSMRDQRSQAINAETTDCILSVPIRLNLGTTVGNTQYVENIQSFLANSSEYWEKRFLNPLSSLYKLNIAFTTYEGIKIPLEKMLQVRRSVTLLETFERIFGNTDFPIDARNVPLSFLFDPVNPILLGREKRNFSMIFKIQTYEYESPGLYLGMIKDMLESETDLDENTEPFIVKASNFDQYN